MALYYQLVFAVLLTEIALFLALIIPIPSTIRRNALIWVSKNVVARVDYTLKIVFVFIFILFVDSINRMVRVNEQNENTDKVSDVRLDTNINSKKFYSQRNMYLTGSTLFLSLVLNYTYSNIMELLNTEEKITLLEDKLNNNNTGTSTSEDQEKKIAKLRDDLIIANKKVVDYETLKKQADQLDLEFNRLSDELSQLQNKEGAEVKKEA
ncbi:B-cell receptor-associated 31-like protein [Neoconidiobolus thromboides FSU 785]|nr:B-cell receptor-associated 31-like protein [Neoconidiobolus thromboides FSU 785]